MVVLTVAGGGNGFDVDGFVEANAQRLHLPRERVRTKAVEGEDVVASILKESAAHDLVVLGCSRDPVIYQFARDPVPQTVARRCEKPVVMVKAAGGIRSWIKRWI